LALGDHNPSVNVDDGEGEEGGEYNNDIWCSPTKQNAKSLHKLQ